MAVNVGEIIATTLRHRTGKLADNVTTARALFHRLNEKGNIKIIAGGRTIFQELEYAENTATGWYSGAETLSTVASEVMDAAEFNWKQIYVAVVANGLETDIQNAGKEAVVDLLESRISNAEKTIKNRLATGVYATGTGTGGKELGGLQLLVADTPTNTVGGIDANTYTFWRNIAFDATTDGPAAASASNIQSYMNRVYLQVVRGEDKPDLLPADNNYYRFYLESLQANQRWVNAKLADAGFDNLKYMQADVVLDGGKGGNCPTNHMYFLNTDYIRLCVAKNRNFATLKPRDSINQDATVRFLTWAGNMTVSNRSLQAVLKD
jgi:hypothetical protein